MRAEPEPWYFWEPDCGDQSAWAAHQFRLKQERSVLGMDAMTTTVVVGGEAGLAHQIVQYEQDAALALAVAHDQDDDWGPAWGEQ